MVVFYKQGICKVLSVAFGSNFRLDKDKNLLKPNLQCSSNISNSKINWLQATKLLLRVVYRARNVFIPKIVILPLTEWKQPQK